MTIRDWFAGKALQGLVARFPINEASDAKLAHVAYKLADEMLVEREKK